MGKWGLHERTTEEQARQNRMIGNLDNCISLLLEREGCYVKPQDELSGLSDIGITKRTFDDFIIMVLSQVKLSWLIY